VPEEAIARAMGYAARELHLVVESGGAVALAAALVGAWTPQLVGAPVAIVVSGGNVSAERIREVTEAAG
jgi:threonine dehydratase